MYSIKLYEYLVIHKSIQCCAYSCYRFYSKCETLQSDNPPTDKLHLTIDKLSEINYKDCWDKFHNTNIRQHNWRRKWIVQPISEYVKNRTTQPIFSNTSINSICTSLHDIYASKHSTPHAENSNFRILDVGCGIGNATYPIINYITDSNINAFVYACDFSQVALKILKADTQFNDSLLYPFYCDLTSPKCTFPFPAGSIDIISMLFVLQAIPPDSMGIVLHRLSLLLKPGGMLIIRNLGEHDYFERKYEKSHRKLVGVPGCYMRDNGIQEYIFSEYQMGSLFAIHAPELVQNYLIMDRKWFHSRNNTRVHDRVWVQAQFECVS